MNRLMKNILWMFVLIVFCNVILQVEEEEQYYMTRPFKFIGISLILSLIGGYVWFQIEKRTIKEAEKTSQSRK